MRIAELEGVEQSFHVLLHVLEFFESLAVDVFEFAAGGNDTVPVFLCQLQCTVNEVAIYGDQFVVVAVLEVFPSEIVVLCLRSVCGEHIAQHVLLAREIDKVFVKPYSPVARC